MTKNRCLGLVDMKCPSLDARPSKMMAHAEGVSGRRLEGERGGEVGGRCAYLDVKCEEVMSEC